MKIYNNYKRITTIDKIKCTNIFRFTVNCSTYIKHHKINEENNEESNNKHQTQGSLTSQYGTFIEDK
jgi:hypothetical protein